MRNILIVAGGVVAVAAIAAGAYFGTRPSTTGPAAVAPVAAPNTSSLAAVQPGDHVLGDPKAPITLIEYASFTCPHCAHFHTQVLPEIKKKWIDTGKVKLVYRDFPLDQVAAKAAQIAECAGNDRYFGVIDIIFRGQPQCENEIKACLANEAASNAVINDYKGGEQMGVNSTPALFIDGQLYRGPRTVEDLDSVLGKLAK
jgi:protein-disulfide isomerase